MNQSSADPAEVAGRAIKRNLARLTDARYQRLAMYNAEVARGIMHTPEWKAQMAELQREYDEEDGRQQ